jgi:hypothetical protein
MTEPVSIRDFRKNLAYHLNGDKAIVIGDHWHNRAILLPLTRVICYDGTAQRTAIARAAKESLRILGELRAYNRR